MVGAVHFFATRADEDLLLDHLGVPERARLFPWVPMSPDAPVYLERADLGDRTQVGILDPALGSVVLARPGSAAFTGDPARSRVLNRLNWTRQGPRREQGIVDWDRTPALFWERGRRAGDVLTPSSLGSQAEAPAAISEDYRRWVDRCKGWVRRRGTTVWDWHAAGGTSPFDVRLPFANRCVALPGALDVLRAGGRGRATAPPG